MSHKEYLRSTERKPHRGQEGYWDEFWTMDLFCMGLDTLNN